MDHGHFEDDRLAKRRRQVQFKPIMIKDRPLLFQRRFVHKFIAPPAVGQQEDLGLQDNDERGQTTGALGVPLHPDRPVKCDLLSPTIGVQLHLNRSPGAQPLAQVETLRGHVPRDVRVSLRQAGQ
jgi:hypothetical protein